MANNAGKVSAKADHPNLTGGSRKGRPNKNTAQLKDMILKALEGAGGVEYLMERANDPRTASAFLTLVGKVLPMQVTGEDGGPVQFQQIKRVIVDPNGTGS